MNETPQNAISLYNQDGGLEDFPVLRAFQQYIDSEQAKARKRLLTLGIFFGVMMFLMVVIFVILLIGVSERNQQLNDRLVEYAMRERTSTQPVVVQPPAPVQDNSAILALTSKIEELQQKLISSQKQVEAVTKAAEEATKIKTPSAEELEIQRLKTLLATEKERTAAEKERQRQLELEAYRRKRWPELYAPQSAKLPSKDLSEITKEDVSNENPNNQIKKDANFELDDDSAIDYFGDEFSSDEETEKNDSENVKPNVDESVKAMENEAAKVESNAERLPLKKSGTRHAWCVPLN